jgi:hypothetical protein
MSPTISTSRPPILVTGAHRSGTTWVGRMLAASGEATYISEPLNVWHRPGVMRAPVENWYTYITTHNQADFLSPFQEMLNFRYHVWAEIKSLRSLKDALRMGRDASGFLAGRWLRKRPLLKDPFAVFSAPWFAEKLNCQVVITVRHPAAVASSLKRLKWSFDFHHLLSQAWLMEDWLAPFGNEMEKIKHSPQDIIGQSCLLWRSIYSIVKAYQQNHPGFQVVRHEDLSRDPIPGFSALYKKLGLRFTPRAAQRINATSSAGNPRELSRKSTHSIQLNSRANLENWKQRLSAEEISRIRQLTADVAIHFYPEEDWVVIA